MKGKISIFLTALCLGLTGCITPPRGLENEQFSITSYKEITSQDLSCHCKNIRLGGKIVQTTILPHHTKIEVLSLPVSSLSGKPFVESQSDGRFIVYFDGFIDPENLKDRYITIGGQLIGSEPGKIEQANYTYPVIKPNKYRLWTLSTNYYYPEDDWDDDWDDDWGFWRWRYQPRYIQPEIRYYLN